jgi:hypothetical protein
MYATACCSFNPVIASTVFCLYGLKLQQSEQLHQLRLQGNRIDCEACEQQEPGNKTNIHVISIMSGPVRFLKDGHLERFLAGLIA